MSTYYYVEPIMPSEILNKLRRFITNPTDNYIDDLIKWLLKNYITRDGLIWAINNNFDVVTAAFNHFGLGHSQVSPMLKTVFRMNWDKLEYVITDVNNVRKILLEKDELRDLLYEEVTIDYLNRCCKNAYLTIYNFVWG